MLLYGWHSRWRWHHFLFEPTGTDVNAIGGQTLSCRRVGKWWGRVCGGGGVEFDVVGAAGRSRTVRWHVHDVAIILQLLQWSQCCSLGLSEVNWTGGDDCLFVQPVGWGCGPDAAISWEVFGHWSNYPFPFPILLFVSCFFVNGLSVCQDNLQPGNILCHKLF